MTEEKLDFLVDADNEKGIILIRVKPKGKAELVAPAIHAAVGRWVDFLSNYPVPQTIGEHNYIVQKFEDDLVLVGTYSNEQIKVLIRRLVESWPKDYLRK